MDRRRISICSAGLLQGIVLVSFPAASTILTDPGAYNFTSTQYGSLFIPQTLFAILAALLNSVICRSITANRTLALGLLANFISMAILTFSVLTMKNNLLSFTLLMVATSCQGIGFGLVVPTINRMTEVLVPAKSSEAVLVLNALLGVGTTLAPVFIALFSALGAWWGLPLCASVAILSLIVWNLWIHLPEETARKIASHRKRPHLLYVFVLFAFLYGIIETINGNWVNIYMSEQKAPAPLNLQSLALTAFWGMVTFGRVFSALMSKYISKQIAFQLAPFISVAAFLIIASEVLQGYWALLGFGLMGFGCSVLLPLTISLGGEYLKSMAASVPGIIISVYLLGYGVAAFGVGPLEEFADVRLRAFFVAGAFIAFVLGLLALYIIHRKGEEING